MPALLPSILAGYAVVGEREPGTLEPVLTTPVRREELVLAKALAAFFRRWSSPMCCTRRSSSTTGAETPPFGVGRKRRLLSVCYTDCIPQGLRKLTPVEWWRQPSHQRTHKTVTADSFCLVRSVRRRNPLP